TGVVLPDGASRYLGLRYARAARADNRAARSPGYSCDCAADDEGICVYPRPTYWKTAIPGGGAPGSQQRRAQRSRLADAAISGEASASCSTVIQRRRPQHSYTGIPPLLRSTISFAREPRDVHTLWSQVDISGTRHIGRSELVGRFL